jgi:hypothetical protein
MQFRLLGPLEFAEQNVAAALGGVKQRSLLAILLIVRLEELRGLERAILLGAIRTRLAAAPPAPTVLVRRGAGRAGHAPDNPGTHFRWSLTGAGS